jgi:hypothetical protein
MSKWRLRGFVQDSDDEEEDLETIPPHSNRESQHNANDHGNEARTNTEQTRRDGEEEDEQGRSEGHRNDEQDTGLSPAGTPRRAASSRPVVSPITPFVKNAPLPRASTPPSSSLAVYVGHVTESPNPLHVLPSPATRRRENFPSSSLSLGAPISHQAATEVKPRDHGNQSNTNGFLEELGIIALSDASDSDILSDPPSDMDEPIIQTTIFASPKHRAAVQVVIPRSTAAQQDFIEQQTARSLRERKPIQLHPYAIDWEKYRRDCQGGGIKPVARQRSPKRISTDDHAETQEQEFNPHREMLSSSPPEIPVSTSIVQKSAKESHGSPFRSRLNSRGERPVASSLGVANGLKRRKLGRSFTQAATPNMRITNNLERRNDDMWAIPQSPPCSISPPEHDANLARRRLTRPFLTNSVQDLPTPSQSSSLQGDGQPETESDVELVVHSLRRSGHRRSNFVISSDSSSGSTQPSGDELEVSESQLKLARKQMKFVLPASHARLDKEAQERRDQEAKAKREMHARRRLHAIDSPDRNGPQRGVAQRITKRRSPHPTVATESYLKDVVTISDESDNDPHSSVGGMLHVQQQSPQAVANLATDLATAFDQRYPDTDSDDMENDRLDLFTLGGPSRKRKKQTNLPDAFSRIKKSGVSGIGTRTSSTSYSHKSGGKKSLKSTRRTPPPALSILDFEQSPSGNQQRVPQFLRIAKRQARQRPDCARVRPTNKHIRLQTAMDTEDAHTTLRQWRSGVLKAKTTHGQGVNRPTRRGPLIDIVNNAQRGQHQLNAEKEPSVVLQEISRQRFRTAHLPRQQELPDELPIHQRTPVSHKDLRAHVSTLASGPGKRRQDTQHKRQRFRAAQLEGLEADYGRNDRRMTFQQGLREVDRQFDLQPSINQPSRNPQLARFLANADTVLPPVPSEIDIANEEDPPLPKKPPAPKRSLKRKVRAQRLDVDTRDYRQPSEPALADLLDQPLLVDYTTLIQEGAQGQPVLQGLGPSGTRYTTTFDVSPLKSDTYFHASTFIGGMELHRALTKGGGGGRDLDQHAGYFTISHNVRTIRCGPWNDETISLISDLMMDVWRPLDNMTVHDDDREKILSGIFRDSSQVLRSLITYFSTRLSFLDPIDRQSFVIKTKQFVDSMFKQTLTANMMSFRQSTTPAFHLESLRMMTYLLVIVMQTRQIAQHSLVDSSVAPKLAKLMMSISKPIVSHILRQVSQLSEFLERNKKFVERENGIQNSEILVESLVVCMHVLAAINVYEATFWDLISQELATEAVRCTDVRRFESLWGTLFTLLPFVEVDDSGIIDSRRRTSFQHDNWLLIRDILKRLFDMYPYTCRVRGSSLNDYVRATLTRCHHLIHFWHWNRCDRMLSEAYDFFAKNLLQNLRREESNGSVQFLEDPSNNHALLVASNDNAFHIFLKCLALGLLGMRNLYHGKKIQSIASRLVPLHGRSNPKEQPMELESQQALRNHHDLLCTLYYASPPSYRPKLDTLRDLVHHETSHREACRLNVHAWACLAAFQLSTNEPYTSAKPLAEWHNEIIKQTLKQYYLAKSEAETFLKSGDLDNTSASSIMVRQLMEKNQEQVIATLRDCVAGMQRAIKTAANPASSRDFLIESGLVELLKLPHFEDARLVAVIRGILGVLRLYAPMLKHKSSFERSQPPAEESQDLYGGESIDVELFYALEEQQPDIEQTDPPLDFIQVPLWNLLSNAFGAESAPDDSLLMDCVDTWALIASIQVSSGARSWSYYINPHASVAWQQLSQTEQTQKFAPYFMAAFITNDPTAYTEQRLDFFNALLLSLADREATLRFQHRFLRALSHVAFKDPLLCNLPFFKDAQTENFDITADTLCTRRLSLISSMLANIRDDFHRTVHEDAGNVTEVREIYSVILRGFMTAMKRNYQQLGHDMMVKGAYVEFVQKVVQFLQQYTADICPILDFFTNSAAFPLPATDPTYVVGRLCGYAPKLMRSGIPKQLSVFVQTVAQQAAAGNQQSYLLSQLETALCTDHSPSKDRTALRDVLLQGVFPSYIEAAFGSIIGCVIAKPILQSLKPILQAALFDVHVFDESNVRVVYEAIMSISYAFIRSTEELKANAQLVRQPYVLHALSLMLDAMTPILSLLDYICGRCSTFMAKPAMIIYVERFNVFIAEMLHSSMPQEIPFYDGEAHSAHSAFSGLSSFCTDGLSTSIQANWSTIGERIFFGQGHARREILVDLGSTEEEKARLANAIRVFDAAVMGVYGEQYLDSNIGRDRIFMGDVDV